jgi:hypothetical protein
MIKPDANTRRANRRLLAGMAFFAVLFCAAVILWKAFLT